MEETTTCRDEDDEMQIIKAKMKESISDSRKNLFTSQLVIFLSNSGTAIDKAIQQKCFLIWRQASLSMKYLRLAQDTIRLLVSSDSTSHMKLVIRLWNQEVASVQKYIELQRESRRYRDHAEDSEVEIQRLRELISTRNEYEEAMRQEIFELRGELERSQSQEDFVDHLCQALEKERNKVALLEDQLHSHSDSKLQPICSDDDIELHVADSVMQHGKGLSQTAYLLCTPVRTAFAAWHWETFSQIMRKLNPREDPATVLSFLCTPVRNAFAAWHWEAFSQKHLLKLSRREEAVMAKSFLSTTARKVFMAWQLESFSRKKRIVGRRRDSAKVLGKRRDLKQSMKEKDRSSEQLQKAIEKVNNLSKETATLSMFKAWSHACTIRQMENSVAKMEQQMQISQNSYLTAKQAICKPFYMFMDSVDKAGETCILLLVLRSWSYARSKRNWDSQVGCTGDRVHNWQCSFWNAKQSARTAVNIFLGASSLDTSCGKPILLSIFQSWSYACNITRLETTVEHMENRVQNWQNSYKVSRQNTCKAIDIFIGTTMDKVCTKLIVLTTFKAWSHVRMLQESFQTQFTRVLRELRREDGINQVYNGRHFGCNGVSRLPSQ